MLLLWSSTASGQVIKPIGRTINEKGDTITLFSIQSEREIVYKLQIGRDVETQLKTLKILDSALKEQHLTLKQKSELLGAQLQETQTEVEIQKKIIKRLETLLDNEEKLRKRQSMLKNIFVVSTAVLSATVILLITAR